MASYAAMGELTSAPTLGYATLKIDRKPAPDNMFRAAIGCSGIAAGVGVACVIGYALTAWEGFALIGIFWLFLGYSTLTFIAFVLGSLYLGFAIASQFHGTTSRRAALAPLLPLLNVPLAIGCIAVGDSLHDHFARQLTLTVTNPSSVPIDSINVMVDGNPKATFEGVRPGETKRLRTQCSGTGQFWLRATQGGEVWEIEVAPIVSFDDYSRGPKHYTVTLAKPATAPTTKPYSFR